MAKKNDLMSMMVEDESDITLPGDESLKRVATLAQEQLSLEGRLADANALVKTLTAELTAIQEKTLPDLMSELGLSELKLESGAKLTIKPGVAAGIRADKQLEAVTWLDGKGLGDIVKDDVTVQFGRDEREQAKTLVLELIENGFTPKEKLYVHPQTLNATVKEQLALGVEFPEEYFSVYTYNKAIIKLPK